MALGPDGNVWFGDQGDGSSGDAVGHITPAGTITEYNSGVDANSEIHGITAGPGGMWFTEYLNDQIALATPDGSITEFSGLTPGGGPTNINDAPDGNVWFTESRGPGAIGRITPAGSVVEFTTGLTPNSNPWDIIPGPDGNLWFTEMAGRVGRITPQGTITEFSAGITGTPLHITTGPDGNLWFTEEGVPAVARITTQGVVTEFSAGLPAGSAPRAITSGADGNLYFTDNGANAIGTVTPDGVITEFSTGITPGADLHGIVTGSDGALWFTEYAGTIGRMRVAPESGTTFGPDSTFTTSSATATSPETPLAVPTAAPPIPKLGSSVVGAVTGGVVRFRAPGKKAFATMGAGQLVPTGSVIDTRKGKVSLVSALDSKGRTQQATFWSGVFTVRQPKSGHGMVDLYLRGTPTGCPSSRRKAHGAAKRRAPIQLWGKDSHGRYRTHGQSAVATVRGTEWLMTETCAGTVTRVVKGSVSVWDLRTHKRAIVRAKVRAARPKAR